MGMGSRSPHGERGLKYPLFRRNAPLKWSLPSRGAWIEIRLARRDRPYRRGRSPHGERGLKYLLPDDKLSNHRRSPHGERGLKYIMKAGIILICVSLPSRGAWIEILLSIQNMATTQVAPLTESVD